MYTFLYIHVCVYIYTHVYLYIYTHKCTRAGMLWTIYMCIEMYTHTDIHVPIHGHVRFADVHRQTLTFHMCRYACSCRPIRTYISLIYMSAYQQVLSRSRPHLQNNEKLMRNPALKSPSPLCRVRCPRGLVVCSSS